MNSQSENIFFLISEETFAVSPGISWVYKGRWYDLNIYSFFPSKLYWLYAWLYVYDFTIGSSREAERNVGYELEQFKKIIPTIESPPFFTQKDLSPRTFRAERDENEKKLSQTERIVQDNKEKRLYRWHVASFGISKENKRKKFERRRYFSQNNPRHETRVVQAMREASE